MPTASFWEIPSCQVLVVELEIGYFHSSMCSTLFKGPAPVLVWFYRCCCQLISSHLLVRNTVCCILRLCLCEWMQSALTGLVMVCSCHLKSSFRPDIFSWKQRQNILYHGLLYSVWNLLHLVTNLQMKPLFLYEYMQK